MRHGCVEGRRTGSEGEGGEGSRVVVVEGSVLVVLVLLVIEYVLLAVWHDEPDIPVVVVLGCVAWLRFRSRWHEKDNVWENGARCNEALHHVNARHSHVDRTQK